MNSNVTNILGLEAPDEMRNSGVDCVGQLRWGAHICQMYASRDELLEILVPYFREGLLSNEYCIWITSELLTPGEAAQALRAVLPELDDCTARGQLEILDYREWYTRDGGFNAERVTKAWGDKLENALERGFNGMRLSGDTTWLAEADWEPFLYYEALIDSVIADTRILAICTYPLQKLVTREIFDAVANHDFAIIRERGRWTTFKSFARYRNEQVMRENEARLRATIDGASDSIVTCDRTGAIVLANVAAQRMFGYADYELVGANVGGLVPALADALRDSVDVHGPHACFIGEGRRKGGAVFPVEWTLSVVTADRQPLFVGFARDLTRQQEAEAQIRKLHADRVSAIGGMATALAHELNQPLTATASYLQAAQRLIRMPSESRPASLSKTLDRAAEQALRAGKILNHIREFVSHAEPDKTIWSLHDLVCDASLLTHESAKQVGVGMTLDLGAAEHLVIADKIQIQQVIVNLSRNALEAMQNAPIRKLAISTSCKSDMIQVDVIDTGPGFPDDVKAALFEPFVTSKAHALGVGLSVSRSIIEAHDGRIWAKPNPLGGSIVSFTLPLVGEDST